MNIEHISISRQNLWSECQAKYRFKYHYKTKSQEPEPFYFIYGKMVHKIAEEYVAAKGNTSIGEIAKSVISGKIEIEKGKKAPKLPSEYIKKLPNHLRSVERFTEQAGFDGEREYYFKYDLDPPNKKCVTGFIDRIIVKGDQFWIIDYKTSKAGWYQKDYKNITKDIQLKCYARVVQKEFGAKPENIKAALIYLENYKIIGATFSEASLIRAEQDLLETYLEIEAKHPDQVLGSVGEWCQRCEYRKVCPFYSLT